MNSKSVRRSKGAERFAAWKARWKMARRNPSQEFQSNGCNIGYEGRVDSFNAKMLTQVEEKAQKSIDANSQIECGSKASSHDWLKEYEGMFGQTNQTSTSSNSTSAFNGSSTTNAYELNSVKSSVADSSVLKHSEDSATHSSNPDMMLVTSFAKSSELTNAVTSTDTEHFNTKTGVTNRPILHQEETNASQFHNAPSCHANAPVLTAEPSAASSSGRNSAMIELNFDTTPLPMNACCIAWLNALSQHELPPGLSTQNLILKLLCSIAQKIMHESGRHD